MSVHKPLLASDILVTPLEVSKGRQYNSTSELTSGGIDIFLGTQYSTLFSTTEPTTGNISTEYERLVYDGVKELYYSNYQSSFIYESSSYYQPQGDTLVNFATASNFNPYITGVGLYNDNKELLAIAKLAKPLPTSTTTDTTILINIDR